MIIRYYKDDGTLIREVQIPEEEEKALSIAMADIAEWHQNFIKHRIGQEIDFIVEKALEPNSELLTKEDKQQLRNLLDQYNIIVADPRRLPIKIKREIVKRANLDPLKPKLE